MSFQSCGGLERRMGFECQGRYFRRAGLHGPTVDGQNPALPIIRNIP